MYRKILCSNFIEREELKNNTANHRIKSPKIKQNDSDLVLRVHNLHIPEHHTIIQSPNAHTHSKLTHPSAPIHTLIHTRNTHTNAQYTHSTVYTLIRICTQARSITREKEGKKPEKREKSGNRRDGAVSNGGGRTEVERLGRTCATLVYDWGDWRGVQDGLIGFVRVRFDPT